MTAPAQDRRIGGAAPAGSLIGIRHLGVGRLVGIMPMMIETIDRENENTKKIETVKRITADVIALDGPPITFGGRFDGSQPDHTMVATPHLISGMWIEQISLIRQITPYLPIPGQPNSGGIAVGRLRRGTPRGTNSAPWLLTDPPAQGTPEYGAFQADLNAVTQWWHSYVDQKFVNTVPGPIAAPPQQQYAQGGYAPQQQYAPPAQPAYGAPMAAGQYQAQSGYVAPPQQQYVQPAPQSAPPAAPPAGPVGPDGVPVGWDPAVWWGLPGGDQQRAGILASMGVAVPAAVPPL